MGYRPYTVVWVGIPSQALKNVGVSSLEEIHKIFVKAAENLDELDTDNDDSYWFSDYTPIVVEDNDGYKLKAIDDYGNFGEIHTIYLDNGGGEIGFGIEIEEDLSKAKKPAEVYNSPKIEKAQKMMEAAINKVFPTDKAERLKKTIQLKTSSIIA